ncbi:MAG: hypothetical protein AAF532_07520 [Planctomycetota bacterium]
MSSVSVTAEPSRREALSQLRSRLGMSRPVERDRGTSGRDSASSNFGPGRTVELLADRAVGLTYAAARLGSGDGLLVWVGGSGGGPSAVPFVAAFAGLHADPGRCVVIRADDRRDALWAAEASLRSGAADGVVLGLDRARDVVLRRLKRAAEAGGGCGVLIRPERVARSACWSDARLRVRGIPGEDFGAAALRPTWSVEVLYRKGATEVGEGHIVELTDAGDLVPVVPELADPAAPTRPTRRDPRPLRRHA